MLSDEELVVVFEVAERTKLEHYQDSHDLTLGEGCLAVATHLAIGGHKGLFVHLIIKFFAKFIHGTENFCNFVVGNHERILLFDFISDWNSDIKVQKISQITNFLCDFLIPNWGIQGSKERISRLTNHDYLRAIQGLLSNIEQEIKANKTDYEGSPYISKYLRDVFGTKEVPVPKDDEERMRGQEDELAEKDWYAYNANYGTSEERAFISLFARRYENFTKKYEDIYVIRNEKVVKIIDKQGRTFEPDFLLYLRDRNCGHAVYQIFIEPKGSHLVGKDKWKEDFLKEIQNSGLSLKIDTDNYHITGIPFYNEGNENEFKEQLENLLLA